MGVMKAVVFNKPLMARSFFWAGSGWPSASRKPRLGG